MLGLCVSRGGYRAGRKTAQFIAEWELAVRHAGGPINVAEFAEFWGDHLATPYRRLEDFHAMFPELGEHGMPSDLMRPLLRRLEAGEDVSRDFLLEVPAT